MNEKHCRECRFWDKREKGKRGGENFSALCLHETEGVYRKEELDSCPHFEEDAYPTKDTCDFCYEENVMVWPSKKIYRGNPTREVRVYLCECCRNSHCVASWLQSITIEEESIARDIMHIWWEIKKSQNHD